MGTPFWWTQGMGRGNGATPRNYFIGAGLRHIVHKDPTTNEPTIAKGMSPETEEMYAFKLIKPLHPALVDYMDLNISSHELPEARFLSSLDHPNIVKFHDICGHNGRPVLVTEYCERNHLRWAEDLLGHGRDQVLNTLLQMTFQVSLALEYLHRKEIFHYDIHTENILIRGDSPGELAFKLSNFSQAATRIPYNYPGPKHPSRAVPPELRGGNHAADPRFAGRCDIWSLGWAVVTLIPAGVLPGDSVQIIATRLAGYLGLPENDRFIGCFTTMLAADPSQRPPADQLLRMMVEAWGNDFFRMNPGNVAVEMDITRQRAKEREARQQAFPFFNLFKRRVHFGDSGTGGNPPPQSSRRPNTPPGGGNLSGHPNGYQGKYYRENYQGSQNSHGNQGNGNRPNHQGGQQENNGDGSRGRNNGRDRDRSSGGSGDSSGGEGNWRGNGGAGEDFHPSAGHNNGRHGGKEKIHPRKRGRGPYSN